MNDPDNTILDCETRRRHAAGENPAKRDQILDGARMVFMDKGFDGASMNDICRAAGVSKGTLYVYFSDKVELFEAMISRERERLFKEVETIIDSDAPLEGRLRSVGQRLAGILCSDKVVRAQRIVIGAAERMPDLGQRFYDAGAMQVQGRLARLFERESEAGQMSVPDPKLAAAQFVELITARIWRSRLFGVTRQPPADNEITPVVDSAIRMFLAAYGTR